MCNAAWSRFNSLLHSIDCSPVASCICATAHRATAAARDVTVDHGALQLIDLLRQQALLEAQRLAPHVTQEETARVERATHGVEVAEQLLVVYNTETATASARMLHVAKHLLF